MREFTLPILKSFQNGLRTDRIIARNSPFLSECTNMKPMPSGLVEIEGIENPFATSKYDSWPFPQLLRGPSETLLVGETYIKSVTEGTPWTVTTVSTYDASDPTTAKVIPSDGGVWHLADFGKTWFLFNESATVFKTGLASMFGDEDKVLVQTDITVATGCSFRGRLITAGFNPANYWSVDWDALLDSWRDSLSYSVSPSNLIGSNFVMWSTIGGGDLTNLFMPARALKGTILEDEIGVYDETFLMDLYRRNELGLIPMPWQGTVYVVKPLGKAVVVYGDHGIALLYPANLEYPTFGLEPLVKFGIKGRGAVNGDDDNHCFTDEKGNLWRLDLEYIPKRLGYKEFFGPLTDIVVTHSQEEDEFYIGGVNGDDEGEGYILTRSGLAKHRQIITSVVETDGEFYGVFDEGEDEAYITTETLDFGYRDLKTITTVEVGGVFSDDVYIAADYRYDKEEPFQTTGWKLVNKEGFGRLQITALEVRLKIMLDDATDSQVDYVNLKWQAVGRRTIRGPYAETSGT